MNQSKTQSLQEQLEAYKEFFLAKADSKKIEVYEEGIKAVLATGILEKALKVGDIAPDFELKNATGKIVKLSDYKKIWNCFQTYSRSGSLL